LNSLDYKIITQQYVYRGDNKYALTDLFFPQLDMHVEIDEEHHITEENQLNDKVREKDIINITGHDILRIDCSKSLEEIDLQIDEVLLKIKEKRMELGKKFEVWDPEKETNPETYIKKGYISVEDDVAFHKIVDAINCFGVDYDGFQRGGCPHPKQEGVLLWFPKLYKNKLWDNKISDDEKTIYEKSTKKSEVISHINGVISGEYHQRIVFARVKNSLGIIMYRFKGKYQLNIERSEEEEQLVWERVSKQVKTYE
jgi:very-short-patch-repair endonuclease